MVYIIDYYHYHTTILLWGMVGDIKPWSHIRYSLYFQKTAEEVNDSALIRPDDGYQM